MHANSAQDVPARLAALGSLAGVPPATVTELAASAVDVVVHLARGPDGARRVREIGVLERTAHGLAVTPAWTLDHGAGAGRDALAAALAARRTDVPAVLR